MHKLSDEQRRARFRKQAEEHEQKEAERAERRKQRARDKWDKASALAKKILGQTDDEVAQRRYRRAHLRRQWLFARKAENHLELLAKRRRARTERMLGYNHETNDTSNAKETEEAPARKRLFAHELLKE